MTFEQCQAAVQPCDRSRGPLARWSALTTAGTVIRGRLTRADSDLRNGNGNASPYGHHPGVPGVVSRAETVLQIADIPQDGIHGAGPSLIRFSRRPGVLTRRRVAHLAEGSIGRSHTTAASAEVSTRTRTSVPSAACEARTKASASARPQPGEKTAEVIVPTVFPAASIAALAAALAAFRWGLCGAAPRPPERCAADDRHGRQRPPGAAHRRRRHQPAALGRQCVPLSHHPGGVRRCWVG